MKIRTTHIPILIATAIFGALSTFAHAGPGIQHWKSLGSPSDFKEMKPGAHAVYVCTKCKTISEIPIKSEEQAMELCKDGSSMTCPSCKKVSKVVVKTERNQAPTHTEVSYVDEHGKECGFMAMMTDKQ